MADDALLRAEGIGVRFGGLVALDDTGIDAPAGEVTGLIGPNGAGKTTLFNVLCGFVAPVSGRVRFGDWDVTGWAPERRAANGIARTFQRLELFKNMTVLENCMAAFETRSGALTVFEDVLRLPRARRAEREAQAHAMEVLGGVGLAWAADRRAGDLPLGMGRLLEVARALALQPRVLLLDEPSSGLNQSETAALGDLIARVTDQRNLAVVLVEHDVSLVSRVCSRVIVLDGGSVIAAGDPETVRENPRVIAAYLGEAAV